MAVVDSTIKIVESEHHHAHTLHDYHTILTSNLDFHQEPTSYSVHNFHAFAAKFPPQIPHLFIEALTQEFDTILDLMADSGTALVEAGLCVLIMQHSTQIEMLLLMNSCVSWFSAVLTLILSMVLPPYLGGDKPCGCTA